MLLAIDTSAGTSVAVVDGDRVLSEASDPGTRGHAELIGTLIQRALADAEASPADITGVVSGMGPGPFTGLRVGIAAARAFAAGRGIPVHPVASHDAVAFGSTAPVLVVTDARRREVAWTTYDAVGANTRGPHLAHPEDLENGRRGLRRIRAHRRRGGQLVRPNRPSSVTAMSTRRTPVRSTADTTAWPAS